MNIINSNQIIDTNVQQPFTGTSLTFLQDASIEVLNALAQSLGQWQGGTGADTYILTGFQRISIGGGNYAYTTGYIYDQTTNQIYFCKGIGSIAYANPKFTLLATPDGVADPCIFSDGSTKNVHYHYTVELNGAGTVINSYNNLLQSFTAIRTPLIVGGTGAAFEGTCTPASAGDSLRYWKDSSDIVHIQGGFKPGGASGNVFQLPVGMRPVNDTELHYRVDATNIGASGGTTTVEVIIYASGQVWTNTTSGSTISLGHLSFSIH